MEGSKNSPIHQNIKTCCPKDAFRIEEDINKYPFTPVEAASHILVNRYCHCLPSNMCSVLYIIIREESY